MRLKAKNLAVRRQSSQILTPSRTRWVNCKNTSGNRKGKNLTVNLKMAITP